MKRRSTSTTTVLAFLSLTTTPCSTRFGMSALLFLGLGAALRRCLRLCGRRCRLGLRLLCRLRRGGDLASRLLPEHGLDARDVAAYDPGPMGLFQLTARLLEAQVELLLLQLGQLVAQLVRALVAIGAGCAH